MLSPSRRGGLLALAAVIAACAAGPAAAAPGDLDASFSDDGFVTTTIGSTGSIGTSVAVQPDGKILVGGHTGGFQGGDFFITRYLADGSPDLSFNGGNARIFPVGSTKEFSSEIALLGDGKVLQVGAVDLGTPENGWFGLARYTSGGDVDTSFDSDGAVTTTWKPEFDGVGVRGMAVDHNTAADPADDKYVVVGYGSEVATGKYRILIARYLATGALDTSFSTDGKAVVSFTENAFSGDVVLQSGKVVVNGHTGDGTTSYFAAARLDSAGQPDPTFGNDGAGRFTHLIPGAGYGSAYDMIAQPDGKLLLATQVESGSKGSIVRLSPDGVLDATFDGDGVVITGFTGMDYVEPYELRVQTDGKIVLAGSAHGSGKSRLLLVRYTPTGALDPTFSGDGHLIDDRGDFAFGRGLAIQSDGNILLSGAVDPAGGPADSYGMTADLALLRFEGDPPAASDPPVNTFLPRIPPNAATPRAKGQSLTGQAGTWTGTGPITFQYIWLRCAAAKPLECKAATARGPLAPYPLGEDDIGTRIRLAEIATNAHGSKSALSEPTAVVSGPLANTEKPRIWGPLFRKGKLNAVPGGWDGPQPLTFAYAWQSCNAKGADCEPRGKAATQSIAKADVGRRFRVIVAATDARTASAAAQSELTPVVEDRPQMPDLRPKKKGRKYSFLNLAAAKSRLRSRRLCSPAGQACEFRMPVEFELDRNGLQDVPEDYRASIKKGSVYDQDPEPGSDVGIGEQVELEIYDPRRNELCKKYLDADINDVKRQLGTNPETVFAKLDAEYCKVAETVRTNSGSVTKSIVTDINRDRTGKAFVVYLLEPLPKREYRPVPQVDTDGDGLWDAWETEGVDLNKDGYYELDLAGMGADPRHKDIFMEIDFMENHPLDPVGIGDIIASFAAAPVTNPDGKNGVTMHIDNGPTSVMNPKTGAKWDTLSDSDQLAHSDQLGSTTADVYDWGPYDTLKRANFAEARRTTFRYVISLHSFAGNNIGRARDMPGVENLGITLDGPSDMIVAANQPCATGHCPLNSRQQGVNLMHELGHLLGLGHGGRAGGPNGTPDIINGKPNYFSIMNYLFSFNGLKKNDGTFLTDYSRFPDAQFAIDNKLTTEGSVYALNEASLNERANLRAAKDANKFTSGYRCTPPRADKAVFKPVTGLNQQIDFDCKDGIQPGQRAADLNNDGAFSVFVSRDDWSALQFVGGAVGGFNAPPPSREKSESDEPTAPELLRAAQVIAGDAKRPTVALKIGRPTRKGKVKLAIAARDNRALAQIVVLLDGEQTIFKLRGKRAKRKLTVAAGRHRIRVESQDAVGNYSKAVSRSFRARAPRARRL
ncbi:MAG: hypothetical protein QOJ22_864 [Thermoleophilaceae bacterium]|nr:hypothetical protein [Thermoleophilaceae bacterium]